MITSELFERVLLAPAKAGGDTLYVVSGYATSMLVNRQLSGLREIEKSITLNVIICFYMSRKEYLLAVWNTLPV